MDRLRQLRQQMAELTAEGREILKAVAEAGGTWTDAQTARFNEIKALLGSTDDPGPLLVEIQALEQQREYERMLETGAEVERPGAQDDQGQLLGAAGIPRETARGPFESLGEQLHAIAMAGMPGGTIDPRLNEIQAATGASVGDPSTGGYMVQAEFTNELERRVYSSGALASRCRVTTITMGDGLKIPYIDEKSRVTGSRFGGVQVFWAAEAATVTATNVKLGVQETRLENLKGLSYVTEQLLEDAPALEAIFGEAFEEEFGFVLDDAILRGDGAGKPLGILNAKALVTVAKEGSQAAATVLTENIDKMFSRCWARSRTNAVWFINQDVEPALNEMASVGAGGVPVYMPPNGLSGAPLATLKGRPVVPIEQCETLGTVGDIVLLDLQQFRLVRKRGIRARSSMHVRFIYDEMTFKWDMRVNGQSRWPTALTPYKGTNTLSPFVALATRA